MRIVTVSMAHQFFFEAETAKRDARLLLLTALTPNTEYICFR
jgi:hypothetical protein